MMRRIHCQTYRQLAAVKAVLDNLEKKLSAKGAERLVVPKVDAKRKPSTEGGA